MGTLYIFLMHLDDVYVCSYGNILFSHKHFRTHNQYVLMYWS